MFEGEEKMSMTTAFLEGHKMENVLKRVFLFALFVISPFSLNRIYAQDASNPFSIRPWAVGQTAAYQTKFYKNGGFYQDETLTYSIVGKENIKGQDYYWIEMEMVTKSAGDKKRSFENVKNFK